MGRRGTVMNNVWEEMDQVLQETIEMQQQVLLKCGRRIVPHLTADDMLQPNDFPELEFHPHFRYEEGILDGLRVARTALLASRSI